MNNQFLSHLKSITPQGMAEEKKMFIPASKFEAKPTKKINMAPPLPAVDEAEELDEATRSKYLKKYMKHKVGTDTTKLDIEDAKRNAAVLRRGGADDETIRQGSFTGKIPMSQYNKVNMAKYRFGSKAARSMEDGKKSPRNVKEEMELDEGLLRKKRLLRARLSGKKLSPEAGKQLETSYDSELSKRVARKLRKGGATKATTRSFFKDKPITNAAKKAFNKFNAGEDKKHRELLAKGVHPKRLGFAESTEISEGSMSSQRIRRKYNKKGTKDRSVLDKMSALANRRALRGGASPEDVKNRMNDPKANVRSLNGLMNFHDTMRTKGGNKRRIAEGSSGMKKGIRMTHAVMVKGHTDIGNRADAAELRAISKINKEAGGTGRITKKPRNYKFSDKEFEVMQGHAKKGLAGKNRSNAVRAVKLRGASGRPDMNESISKKYKKTKKTAKRVLKKLGKALSTPRDAVDVMITGRNF